MTALLGGLTPEAFLAEYWQQRPLLVRGAFERLPVAISPEELAGLALESDVESRVVMGETAREDWMVVHGPFEAEFFTETPDDDWTLLVQDVDKHLPAFAAMLAPFRFLPDWRIDDLMVSYAAPGGTVGPHLDRYDVFLIQASGHRRWKIQQPAPAHERLRDHPQLRLLADFEATDEWVLGPGDMLYLPPGVPHYGIAEDDCVTYSVGFRAPSGPELLAAWATERQAAPGDDDRYRDPPGATATPGALSADTLAALRRLVREAAAAPDATLDDWIARHLTEPKPAFRQLHATGNNDADAIAARLAAGETAHLNPAVRLLIADTASGRAVYIHGELAEVAAPAHAVAERLAHHHRLEHADLPAAGAGRDTALELLARWRGYGYVLFDEDLEDVESDEH
ncbi:cupin domain-containing protein [Arhodomonas sp. AD133]|uniref:cupin domain-containing protein n=1 Tax=Arhodomonas sp. AD133 TaxID=3415009 RepID=UPI003EB94570